MFPPIIESVGGLANDRAGLLGIVIGCKIHRPPAIRM
jgi:hypothetical protein